MDFEGISQFYDVNAKAISQVHSKKFGIMHPSVDLPNSIRSTQRSRYVPEEFICKNLQDAPGQRVLDLGSGFSASMLYLSNIYGDTIFSGICASESEIEQSRIIIREAGKVKTILVFKGDFEDTRNFRVFPIQNLVYSIDSFRHVRQPTLLLSNVAALLSPGSSFFIVDCFANTMNPALQKHKPIPALTKFLKTSASHQIIDLETLLSNARAAGFELVREENWSALVRRSFWRKIFDEFIHFSYGLIDKPFGKALTIRAQFEHCLDRKVFAYHALEFKRK